jgi:hypothetical protein
MTFEPNMLESFIEYPRVSGCRQTPSAGSRDMKPTAELQFLHAGRTGWLGPHDARCENFMLYSTAQYEEIMSLGTGARVAQSV